MKAPEPYCRNTSAAVMQRRNPNTNAVSDFAAEILSPQPAADPFKPCSGCYTRAECRAANGDLE
jgi:hypothetical protein